MERDGAPASGDMKRSDRRQDKHSCPQRTEPNLNPWMEVPGPVDLIGGDGTYNCHIRGREAPARPLFAAKIDARHPRPS